MGSLTFGLVAGFTVTALPFLLSRAGVSVDRIASISAVAMSPTFWGFLVVPVLDTGFSRRTYALVMTALSAGSLALSLFLFSPSKLALFTALVLIAELAVVLQTSAVMGWLSEFVPDSQRGAVGGWTNAANLGGGAFGAMGLMSAARVTTSATLGFVTLIAVLLSAVFLFWFPKPAAPAFHVREVFGDAIRNIGRTCRRHEVLIGFLLFLTPAGAVAAINLFSGLGHDFHTTEGRVVWVTGAGVAITSSIGALLGGYIADRVNRGVLYLGGGVLAGLTSLTLAFAPHTEFTFTCGVLFYNAVAGLIYAAFSALQLQLTGTDNPTASTQMALFAASTNRAITYMTWFDGQGYRLHGVRGLFVADGAAAVITALALMAFVVRGGRLRHR
ncbi:MAG TPA: MFS transporter [Bryobacteraceae bacterium]|nr:MFS transporter [Bryobacteraceae bacterium]